MASYAPWFAQAERTRAGLAHCGDESPCRLGLTERFVVFVDHQRALVDFHAGLDTDNPEAAPAWSWATQGHPANLFSKPCLPEMDAARSARSMTTCAPIPTGPPRPACSPWPIP